MKTALIIEGGGLRSAFAFGVLSAWSNAAPAVDDTIAVGLSALAASYYRAGQGDALEAAWGNYFEAHGELGRLAALKGEQAVDADAFLATALEAAPIDMTAFAAAPGALNLGTTRSDNGESVLWQLAQLSELKHLRHYLRAGLAFPGANEPVQLAERSYYSGTLVDPLPLQQALDADCTRIVVIRTHPADYTMVHPRLTPALALSDAPMLRNAYLLSHLRYNSNLKTLHTLEQQGRALTVAPIVESTDLHRYGVSRSAAAEFYSEGLRLGKEALDRVQQFLEA